MGSRVGRDLAFLGAAALRSLPAAFGLALASAALLLAIQFALGSFPLGICLLLLALFWFHGVFIAAVTWRQVHPSRRLAATLLSPGLAAGALLAVPILMFGLLDAYGSSYECADGVAYRQSPVPNLPWLWIGWACMTFSALPARVIGLVMRETPPLISLLRRLVLAMPFVPLIALTGAPFELSIPDCTPPFDGWGLFEGGAVLFPLLGLSWFVLSYSMALLAAASVDQERLGALPPAPPPA